MFAIGGGLKALLCNDEHRMVQTLKRLSFLSDQKFNILLLLCITVAG